MERIAVSSYPLESSQIQVRQSRSTKIAINKGL